MKFNKRLLIITFLILFLTGCGRGNDNNNANLTPTVPIPTDTVDNTSEDVLTIFDYFPLEADTEYSYEGVGNEYASYIRTTDYLDLDKKLIQTRTNNGGTETVRVIEIRDGKVTILYTLSGCFYRDNFLNKTINPEETEILLMEPLVKGTEWTLKDGRRRFISNTKVRISTPTGDYEALEVTSESSDSSIKDYYAPGAGLIKSIFLSEDLEVVSTLTVLNADVPYAKTIDVYYPDSDEKIYVEPITLYFLTNDITRTVLQEAIKEEAIAETLLPILTTNTIINSMYLGEDNIAYIDFSQDLVNEMNAGAGYEQLILQSITNTLGSYYDTQTVSITIDGKPYSSGHILLKQGETLTVNMNDVVR